MLNRTQLLQMLVGLKEVDDLDLVENNAVLRDVCRDSDRETVRSMAAVVNSIYCGFDYAKSAVFAAKLDGKSEQVKATHLRLLNAEKQSDAVRRLGIAIVSLLNCNDAYQMVVPEQHHLLDKLQKLALSISE